MDAISLLERIGLTRNDSRVYLYLLQNRGSFMQELARNTKMTRPTLYNILNKLDKLGLITSTPHGQSRLWSAVDFTDYINSCRLDLKCLEQVLNSLQNKAKSRPAFEVLYSKYKNQNKLIQLIQEQESKVLDSDSLYIGSLRFDYYKQYFSDYKIIDVTVKMNLDLNSNLLLIAYNNFIFLSFNDMRTGLFFYDETILGLVNALLFIE